ncbi:hypothetical protein ACOBR2_02765 [Telmatobacter bradus]
MMIFLISTAVLVLAGSVYADYKWHSWMLDQQHHQNDGSVRGSRL